MRRFVTAGFLALTVALLAGCSDQDKDSPTEPQFKPGNNKVSYDCDAFGLQEQKDALDEAVESILMNRRSVKGALSNTDNTARKVCVEEPNYPAALEQYYEFEILVNGQSIEKLVGDEVARQALLAMAYSFATGGDYNPGFSIPPEALGPDGGLFVINSPAEIPTSGLDLVAASQEGALRIFPGTFPPDAFPVTVVEYRLPDNFSSPDYSFAPYVPIPELWYFDSSVQLIPLDEGGAGLEVWVCVVDDSPDLDTYYRSVIAHALDEGGVELLEPPIYDNSPLNCTDAAFQSGGLASAGTPGWLQLAGAILEPVVNRILNVKPLHAMYFAGKGLGGRGGSLSPHAPIVIPDPVISYDSSVLNVPDPDSPGDSINYYHFTTSNWADYPNYLFEELTPGGCPSRTSLEIFDAAVDTLVTSTCDFDSPDDIASFSFVTPDGQAPPDVYVELWDRDLDKRYRSNTHVFTPVFHTLTIVGAGDGSGFLNDGFYFNCTYDGAVTTGDCTGEWVEWVRVRGITPTADAGSTFDGWSGDCTGPVCDVNMDADRNATMTFTEETAPAYALNLNVGANGTVSDSKGNGPCGPTESCPYTYETLDFGVEELLTLTATPDNGYTTAWDAACYHSAGNLCALVPDVAMSAYADFLLTPTLSVTVTSIDGNAGNPVLSDDLGHSCSLADGGCVWSYPGMDGASVTLTLTPDGSASGVPNMIISSADACGASGSGGTPVECTFTAAGDKSVIANVWNGV